MPVRVVPSGARTQRAASRGAARAGAPAASGWSRGRCRRVQQLARSRPQACCLWLRCGVASSAQTTRGCRTNPAATAALSGRPVFEPHTRSERQASSVQRPAVRSSQSAAVDARHAWTASSLTLQNAVLRARAGCERQRACSTSQAARCWRRLAFAVDHAWLARSSLLLRMLQALQVRPSQVLAVAVSVMGFDYSHGRRPPSDPQCIPVASLKESHGLRVAVLCPERRSAPSLRRRPVPSLSGHRGLLLACKQSRARRFIRHHPAHSAERLLAAVLRCHHPWDTIMTRQKR